MASVLHATMASTPQMLAVFSDERLIREALRFEAGLATVQARLGLIPDRAASAIKQATEQPFDLARITSEAARAGAFAIPLVKHIAATVALIDKEAAGFIHFGATSQDVSDTALVLQLREACRILDHDVLRVAIGLRRAIERHGHDVLPGRTLLQPGPPVTFGLKAASWLLGITDGLRRFRRERDEALMLQFGGAVGTLAALGSDGIAVSEALGAELGLAVPAMPWHTRRDALIGLCCAAAILVGSLGKIARDLSLMMQYEVGEAFEPSGEGRGGSSTLPHKRNPIGSMIALSAAARAPGLVATLIGAMTQEHERAIGGWQAEATTIAALFEIAHGAVVAMVECIEGLEVDPARMGANIEALHGLVLAERLMILLAPRLGRTEAHHVVEDLVANAVASGAHLRDVASADARVRDITTPADLARLFDARSYLGSADQFVTRARAKSESFLTSSGV